MKKIIMFIPALAICAIAFTGCGKSDQQLLNEEATTVYNIVEKYNLENPESSSYTLTFSLDTENISDNLDNELIEELKEHFGEKKYDYKIGITWSSDGALDSVKLWFREDFNEAWSKGDYNAETVIYGEYSE